MERDIFWSQLDQPGMEHFHLLQSDDEIHADGLLVVVVDNEPVRVHYHIRCDASWCVRELFIELLQDTQPLRQGAERGLHVYADGIGHWSDAAGAALPTLDGCIDVDISVTPFTNTLPIRRLTLTPGAPQEIVVAYIKIPEMQILPFKQRYTCLSQQEQGGIYRYESVLSGFMADLSVDGEGLVIDYPGYFQKAWPL